MSTIYQNLIKGFSDENKERFNSRFIMSRSDDSIQTEITNIFKSLEVINEIHIKGVIINSHEEEYGPIKQQGHYYKSPMESRLLKIHYSVAIDGLDHAIEKDMFLPKMLDSCFYVNDGVRFYPIWQVVDNLSYKTNNGVSLKSLLMPVTIIRNDPFNYAPEFSKGVVTGIPDQTVLLFSKKVSPIFYFMMNWSLASLKAAGVSPFEDLAKFQEYQDPTLIDKFREFIGVDIRIDDDPLKLAEDGRTVFVIRERKDEGLAFSVPTADLETERGKAVVGMMLAIRGKDKKHRLAITKDQFITPWFWLDQLIEASGFSRSADQFKRLEKIQGVYLSLMRIIDGETRRMLPIPSKDKQDIFTILRYLIFNFNELFAQNPQDLHNKRVRLYEYILYPLRVYFSQHINRLINQQSTRDVKSVEKVFTSLTPMFLIKSLITSQLLRTYNSANEFNLFSAYLKGTFKGPQALGKGVSFDQRDLDPSYVGRIGLVAASPGDPGVSFTFSPFLEIYGDGYFDRDQSNATSM